MKIINKSENWWLRLTIVLITVLSLTTLSFYNKQITEIKSKSKTDSLSYYKLKCDTLLDQNHIMEIRMDSLYGEWFNEKTINGRYELGLDFLKERRPNEYNLLMHYIGTQTE